MGTLITRSTPSEMRFERAVGQYFTMPSMVDTEVHNPSLQEIITRFTRGEYLGVTEHTPLYDFKDDTEHDLEFSIPFQGEDLSDLLPRASEATARTTTTPTTTPKNEGGEGDGEGVRESEEANE